MIGGYEVAAINILLMKSSKLNRDTDNNFL